MDEFVKSSSRWAVVLAGGDGRRLQEYGRDTYGEECPKQFCRFGRPETLLTHTVRRALLLVPEERIVVVIQREHRALAASSLAGFPAVQVVTQPNNRDTLPGLTLPLLHIVRQDPGALVLVLPSDHHVEDDAAFAAALSGAAGRVEAEPGAIALLGAPPDHDEGYGWVVPKQGMDGMWASVSTFREKPSAAEAAVLARSGGKINTFVLAARAARLLRLVASARPDWYGALVHCFLDPVALDQVYDALPPANFSLEVLERAVPALRLVPIGDVGWTDVGTPSRLARALGRQDALAA